MHLKIKDRKENLQIKFEFRENKYNKYNKYNVIELFQEKKREHSLMKLSDSPEHFNIDMLKDVLKVFNKIK